jgi:hypothetical protein
MVKQTLDRYPGTSKDRLASENFRVSRNDFLHGCSIAPAATLCEAKVVSLTFAGNGNHLGIAFVGAEKKGHVCTKQILWEELLTARGIGARQSALSHRQIPR